MSRKPYREWRKAVFDRDGMQCVRCGVSGSILHTHHIIPYANNKRLSMDVENGVTLCPDCHRAFHTQYGKKNNTKKQFDEFLQIKNPLKKGDILCSA